VTTSEKLIDRARKEALMGPEAGSELARITRELCDEYAIAVSLGIRADAFIHKITKNPKEIIDMMTSGDWWEIAKKYAKETT
jgi:hypothetical protein